LLAAGLFKARLVPFPAAFGGGDEAGLTDLVTDLVLQNSEAPRGLRGSKSSLLIISFEFL
jgi:hypothetical protein